MNKNNKLDLIEFSYFKCPIHNTTPYRAIRLVDLYIVIKGYYFKSKTDILQKIADKKQARYFKAHNFDYVTFSGLFSNRHNSALIKHSGLMVIDFDN